tara:strand:- start:485 stop:874 length:390 start_codon:yes stop_codon:yes gene_type:complete
MENVSVKSIQTNKRRVFIYWLEFLKPYHKLANKEMEALGTLLYYRFELAKEISNTELVDRLLFSSDMRKKVRSDLGDMKSGVFNNLLTALRIKKVITKDNKIHPSLIPNMDPDSNGFKLIFNFEINETK